MSIPLIFYHNVHKSIGEQSILRGVSLSVERGEIFYVLGKSGAGKSVMSRLLVGLLRPDCGSIQFEGDEVTVMSEEALYGLRRRCVLVFQQPMLFDDMTALENVCLPLRRVLGYGIRQAARQARARMDSLGISARESSALCAQLGVGIKKKLSIARALVMQPDCVILDEPTTGLIRADADLVDEAVRASVSDVQCAFFVISHDLVSMRQLATRVAFLDEGRIAHVGAPADLEQAPASIVKQFLAHAIPNSSSA